MFAAGLLERSIQDRTGAKIDISRDSIPGKDGLRTPEGGQSTTRVQAIESRRKMECIGPLLSIYSAHTLMMQRLQERTRVRAAVLLVATKSPRCKEVEQTPPPARSPPSRATEGQSSLYPGDLKEHPRPIAGVDTAVKRRTPV